MAGGDDYTKMLYLPIALEQAPLAELESLPSDSIDNWHTLKKAFITNFQGSLDCTRNKYELQAIKQKPNESIRDYNRRFWEKKATCLPIPDSDVINIFQARMLDPDYYCQFGMNRPNNLEELHYMVGRWMDTDD